MGYPESEDPNLVFKKYIIFLKQSCKIFEEIFFFYARHLCWSDVLEVDGA